MRKEKIDRLKLGVVKIKKKKEIFMPGFEKILKLNPREIEGLFGLLDTLISLLKPRI